MCNEYTSVPEADGASRARILFGCYRNSVRLTSRFQILAFEKLGSMEDVAGRLSHNFRERETANADPSRLAANSYYGATSVKEAIHQIESRLPAKVRKNGVRVIEFMITASPEAMVAKDRLGQDAYFEDGLAYLRQKFGAKNVIAPTIHRDETTPHLAAFIVPIDPEGGLNARHFTGGKHEGPKKLKQLHTEFFEKVGQRHRLERGIEGSGATHTSIKKYYAWVKKAEKGAAKADAILSSQQNVPRDKRADGELSGEIMDAVRSVPALQVEIQRQKLEIDALKRANSRLVKEREKTIADYVRDLPLAEVLDALGASQDREDKNLWRSARGTIEIDPKKPHKFKFRESGASGRRAIDLVMMHDDVGKDDAVRWLASHLPGAAPSELMADAGRAAAEKAEDRVEAILAAPTAPPPLLAVADGSRAMAEVGTFLIRQNGVSSEGVAYAINNNLVQAAQVGPTLCAAFPLGRTKSSPQPAGWYLASTRGDYEGVRGTSAPFIVRANKGPMKDRSSTIAIFTESPLDALAIGSAFRSGLIAKGFDRLIAIATAGISFDVLKRAVKAIALQARAMVAEFVRDDRGRTMSGHFTRALKEEKIDADNRGYTKPPFPDNCTRWIEAALRLQEWKAMIEKVEATESARRARRAPYVGRG